MVSNLIIKTNLKSDKLLINQSSKKLNILIFLIKNIKDFIFCNKLNKYLKNITKNSIEKNAFPYISTNVKKRHLLL